MFLASSASASARYPVPDEPWHEEFPAVFRPNGQPLIEDPLYLVRAAVTFIKACLPAHIEADDLHSAGLTGLGVAARKCDPDRVSTFSAYDSLRCRGAIFDAQILARTLRRLRRDLKRTCHV